MSRYVARWERVSAPTGMLALDRRLHHAIVVPSIETVIYEYNLSFSSEHGGCKMQLLCQARGKTKKGAASLAKNAAP